MQSLLRKRQFDSPHYRGQVHYHLIISKSDNASARPSGSQHKSSTPPHSAPTQPPKKIRQNYRRIWGRGPKDGGGDSKNEGELAEVAAGKVIFTVDGKLDTEEISKTAFNFKGGALQNQKIKMDFGDSITTDKGTGMNGSKQYGKESDLISWKQDGSAAGTINNLSFNDEGVLTALYSNGETQDLAQVAMAKFENPEALFKVGNNRLKEARDSGAPAVGAPGRAGRGKIYAKSLERSTVDLALEFVNLIQPTDDITTYVTWRSSNTAVATVNSNGLAKGLAAGTTIITAAFEDVSGGTILTVTAASLSSITVTPANSTIPGGTTQQFTAIGAFSDGTIHDVTSFVTWTSINTAVATINSNGLVTALTAGTTTITATSGAVWADTTLTII